MWSFYTRGNWERRRDRRKHSRKRNQGIVCTFNENATIPPPRLNTYPYDDV